MGLTVGSAFGIVSLASTGDWAWFGKSFGLSVAGGAAAWGGGTVIAFIGSFMGPIGTAVGAAAGSTVLSRPSLHIVLSAMLDRCRALLSSVCGIYSPSGRRLPRQHPKYRGSSPN